MQDLGRYTKRTHVEIQTKYLSFFFGGLVALVGLVFALGILVGSRQPNQANCPSPDPLAQLDSQSNEPSPPAGLEPTKLSFHESLAKTADPVPTPASLLLEPSNTNKPKAVATSSVQPSLKELPIPETLSSDEPGYFSLQVGSFQNRQEANRMIRKLERAGHKTYIVSVHMPERGGIWYRVRVGPFQTKREAWSYKRDFEDRERLPAFVVKRRAKG